MSIIDSIKSSVLEGFSNSISAVDIVFGLLTALLAGVFILFIYRSTMRQVTFHRSFCLTVLLVPAISAMMVLTITSNLALSLGMVGALSIVRFRTAVKDPADTAFLFWAVAAGITAGAGFFLLTLIGCLMVGGICAFANLFFDKTGKLWLLVIRGDQSADVAQVEKLLKSANHRFSLTSLTRDADRTEVIYEVDLGADSRKTVDALRNIPGIADVSLVDCRKG